MAQCEVSIRESVVVEALPIPFIALSLFSTSRKIKKEQKNPSFLSLPVCRLLFFVVHPSFFFFSRKNPKKYALSYRSYSFVRTRSMRLWIYLPSCLL